MVPECIKKVPEGTRDEPNRDGSTRDEPTRDEPTRDGPMRDRITDPRVTNLLLDHSLPMKRNTPIYISMNPLYVPPREFVNTMAIAIRITTTLDITITNS